MLVEDVGFVEVRSLLVVGKDSTVRLGEGGWGAEDEHV